MLRGGFSIGKIFGININIDWSWLFIFLLITWNLAVGVFPSLHPEWSTAMYWGFGLIASLLFFASVLIHELSHSLVAIARGLPVRRITLFLFGGVANIEREPDKPSTEFLMAIVGPITSFLLGVLFIYLASVTANGIQINPTNPLSGVAQLGPVPTMFLWLGPINILLAVFNMIPGFPLDGGRVLRSIFWAITNNLRTATRWATIIGQSVAWLFIIAGVAMVFGIQIPFFGTGFLGGLWLIFIGWFLNQAASQSYQQVVVEDILEGVPVARLMRTQMPTVAPDLAVSDLVDNYLMGTDERAFPVVEGDRLVGLVCLEDVRKVPRSNWDQVRAIEIMTPAEQLDTVNPREDVSDALQKLTRRDVEQMPVVQNGQLIGLLRQRDIVRWLQLHDTTAAS